MNFLWLLITFAAVLIRATLALAGEIPLEDFDRTPLGKRWSANGPVKAERTAVTEPAAGAAGQALHLTAEGRSAVISKPGTLALKELPKAEQLVFRARGGKEATVFDMVFPEEDGKACFWRKVELPAGGAWQEIRLPLAWFRWESGRVPDWSRVTSLGFRLRSPTELWIDGLALCDDDPARGADVTLAELEALAFESLPAPARHKDAGAFWLLTNAPALELDKLAEHLFKVLAQLRADLGLPEKGGRPVVLIVFAEDAQYRDSVGRYAKQLNAAAEAPKSDGFHLQGVALSCWKEAQGTLRPVFLHEFVHGTLSELAGVDSARMCWLQEGMANRYQLEFHPQASLAGIIAEGLAKPDCRTELKVLCNGENIPMNRYWQAATVVDLLLTDPALRTKVPALMEAIRREGSTRLEPHLEKVLGMTWAQFEEAWRRHAMTMAK